MKVRAVHTTTYLYSQPVFLCHTQLHLKPRSEGHQRVVEHQLVVLPAAPEPPLEHVDYFGNQVTYFSVQEPHQTLTITASSVIEKQYADPFEPCLTPVWEEAKGSRRRPGDYEFAFGSPRVTIGPEFAEYGRPSFTPGRPLLEAALDLSHRIHSEFEYDNRATTVSTPVTQVLRSRRGVCQDFAHFMIACLRSLGLSARYVSGYLRSGDLLGAEASHAWVSIFCPGIGWLDLDPTNDQLVNGDHVTLAWGRDYSDVAPVNGVALGGGEHVVNVSVSVSPV